VFLLGAAFQSSNSVPGQLNAIQSGISDLKAQNASLANKVSDLEAQVASLANKGQRKFYLTPASHTGAEALSACAAGYHMASLWEIHDPTTLRCDSGLGHATLDSGSGPPVALGWIRTGTATNPFDGIGTANCNVWTSASGLNKGTVGFLSNIWAPRPRATAYQ
jgi:hypothetical protein